ncbi:MAG TPA: hypothetical protein VM285_06645 [Polyangia bacterium]|nr:hypothetical protein [Polyangia bacterium]
MRARLVVALVVLLPTSLAGAAAAQEPEASPPALQAPVVVETSSPPPTPEPGAPLQSPAVGDDRDPGGEVAEPQDEEQEEEDHAGFFFRFRLGLGWAWMLGQGTLRPAKGLRLIEDPEHDSPAFNLALDLGGGFLDLGLHVGVLYERMILRADEPEEMGFSLFGLGGGLTYYFTDNDFFATAEVRLIGMLIYFPGVICSDYYPDRFESYRGPSVSLTLGKEWFGDDDGGIGLGLQGNYARLEKDGGGSFDYASVMLVLLATHF